jgi:hypothetical protein
LELVAYKACKKRYYGTHKPAHTAAAAAAAAGFFDDAISFHGVASCVLDVAISFDDVAVSRSSKQSYFVSIVSETMHV